MTPFIIITVLPIIFFIITDIKNDLLVKIVFLNALSSNVRNNGLIVIGKSEYR